MKVKYGDNTCLVEKRDKVKGEAGKKLILLHNWNTPRSFSRTFTDVYGQLRYHSLLYLGRQWMAPFGESG
jgi:hypothetical protein